MGYTTQAISGFSFLALLRVFVRALSLFKNIIIARALSPFQFGAFGIATLVLVFAEIVTETGINTFLIQNREDIDKYINTSWIVSILRGIIILILIMVSASFIAEFFKNRESQSLLFLISLVPLLRGFINPSIVKFQKELMFRQQFYYQSSIFLVETFFSIVLVLWLKTTEALIYGMIVGVLFEIAFSFLIAKPIPKFNFKFDLFKKVVGYGKWITLQTIFNYFYQHGDDIAVGRLLGISSLGFYDMAYRISLVPLSDVSDVVSKVTLPVYIKISDEKERLRRAFVRTLFVICFITIPIGFIIFLFPNQIISLILGEKWLPAAPALKLLGIFAFIRAISSFSMGIFIPLGKQNIFTLISLVGLLGLIITIVPFTQTYGILGAALSALTGTILTIPVIFYFVRKLLW